jgi:Domain of unknown function (DUF4149)
MMSILRFLQFLALGIWLGGIVFLSFVEAPGVFSILASREQAGSIVGYSLTRLHYIGIAAAIIYVCASLALARSPKALVQPTAILVGLMLVLTLVSEFGVRPRMAVLRGQMDSTTSTSSAPAQPTPDSAIADSARAKFDRLHRASVQLEGATLLIGLAALFLTARKPL